MTKLGGHCPLNEIPEEKKIDFIKKELGIDDNLGDYKALEEEYCQQCTYNLLC